MMALTPKRLFLYLCISISLLRPYTLFSRSPLVNKTLFENACELEWVVLYFNEEWKTVPWVWEKFCNNSDLFTLFGLKFWKVIIFTRERSKRNLNLGPEFSVGAVRKWSSLSASFSHALTKYVCVLLWQRAEPWARSDAAQKRNWTEASSILEADPPRPHCRVRSRRRCQNSISGPITAKP